jgi:penicillin amidase
LTRIRPTVALFASVVLVSCTPVRETVRGLFRTPAERLAETVTIRRDEWGVPHISGPTDAAVVFGLAYAQAEDNFWQVEEDFIHALGRAAELYGEVWLEADLVKAAFEVERLSRAEYAREPRERRRVWDAYALGLEYFLETHPEVRPRLLARFEPWFVFAHSRTLQVGTVVDGIRLGGFVARALPADGAAGTWQAVGTREPGARPPAGDASAGSSAWAVAPSRSASGHALLFQNELAGFFGTGQRYEAHLQSEEGWHFSGFTSLGSPVPRSGHNEHLGWSHTESTADVSDAWAVTFDHPTDPLSYRYDGDWRQAVEWEDTLRVRVDSAVVARRYRFRRTEHGPVVALDSGRAFAVRTARFEDGGSIQQWYAMSRARSLDEFLAALGQTALPMSNTMYADTAGNILYVHGNAVPRRDPAIDWTAPVDGSDPRTRWQGHHGLDELPQLLNPASGWLQNASSTPFHATADGHNLHEADFPSYMVRGSDNGRARVARALLAADSSWTFEEWVRAAFDTRVIDADTAIPAMVDEWERLGALDPERAMLLDAAIDSLRGWDRVSTVTSIPMTYFLLSLEQLRQPGESEDAWPRMRALETVLEDLRADQVSTDVAWGDINRLQRIHTSGDEPFDPERPSLPVAGAPAWAGTVFSFDTRPGPAGKLRFGTGGPTAVGIVDFGPRLRARTIVPFGQNADPGSGHFFDQAQLYARGELKDAWFAGEDVERAVRRTYRPGPAATR